MSLMSMMKSRSLERRPSAISVIPPAHVYKAFSDVDTSSYILAPGCQLAIRTTTLFCQATTSERLHPSPERTDLPTPLNISQPNCRRSSVLFNYRAWESSRDMIPALHYFFPETKICSAGDFEYWAHRAVLLNQVTLAHRDSRDA